MRILHKRQSQVYSDCVHDSPNENIHGVFFVWDQELIAITHAYRRCDAAWLKCSSMASEGRRHDICFIRLYLVFDIGSKVSFSPIVCFRVRAHVLRQAYGNEISYRAHGVSRVQPGESRHVCLRPYCPSIVEQGGSSKGEAIDPLVRARVHDK